jgi:5-hydroxyisourate hydrolase
MAKLSTHALDLHQGRPAGGLRVDLYRLLPKNSPLLLRKAVTNSDGRTDAPLLQAEEMEAGSYELLFHVGSYFQQAGIPASTPPFLDEVPVRFAIADASASYHVPLLFSLWAYSTYRGS